MRTRSILTHCLPFGLIPSDRGIQSISDTSERDNAVPSPAVEVLPSKTAHPYKYAGENVDLQGLNLFKGRTSIADIIGLTASEPFPSKSEGSLRSWEGSVDLVSVLKREIRDGQLSFRGKHVLELGCGHGFPGIFACIKGASTIHFQDLNAETIRCVTIPNVLANLEQAHDRQNRQSGSPVTPRFSSNPDVHFYAGDWDEVPSVLSLVKNDGYEMSANVNLNFLEEDFLDGCGSQDGSTLVPDSSSARRSRKLSGSRAWERATDIDPSEGGYDIILMKEIPYSMASLRKLYALIKKCLRPPYGVMFIAAKKSYVGFHTGVKQMRAMLEEDGLFGAHLLTELADREIWKFFIK